MLKYPTQENARAASAERIETGKEGNGMGEKVKALIFDTLKEIEKRGLTRREASEFSRELTKAVIRSNTAADIADAFRLTAPNDR